MNCTKIHKHPDKFLFSKHLKKLSKNILFSNKITNCPVFIKE